MNWEELQSRISLEGNTAIVTGASRPNGMGFAIAKALAIRGANVVITDIAARRKELELDERVGMGSKEQLDIALDELKKTGAKVDAFTVDITVPEEVSACVDYVKERFGGISILVNNAGVFVGEQPFFSLTERDWSLSYNVHVQGVMNFCKAVIPEMESRGGGVIINNASIAALAGYGGASAYAASKWGLIGLTKSLAAEFGEKNIRINAICPGSVKTDVTVGEGKIFAENLSMTEQEVDAMLTKASAMRRFGHVDEVAETVAFLSSRGAAFINGAAIPITGGAVAGLF